MARRRTKTTTDTEKQASGSIVTTTMPAPESMHPDLVRQETVRRSAADDTRTRIEKLAYELYQQGGCRDGYDRDDWLEAERLALGQQTGASKNGNVSGHPSPSLM